MFRKIASLFSVTVFFISQSYATSVGTFLKIENNMESHAVTVVPADGADLLWKNSVIPPQSTQSGLAFENSTHEDCFGNGTHYSNNFSIVTEDTQEKLCDIIFQTRVSYCAGDNVDAHRTTILKQGASCHHRTRVVGMVNHSIELTVSIDP